MKLLQENRPAVLHGAKVGLTTLYAARRYEILRGTSRDEAARSMRPLDADEQVKEIRSAYGPVAGLIEEIQQPFLQMSQADYQSLQSAF